MGTDYKVIQVMYNRRERARETLKNPQTIIASVREKLPLSWEVNEIEIKRNFEEFLFE